MSGVRASSLLRDVVSTSFVQLATVALGALSLAVVSRRLGSAGLGEYALERRAMALLQPFALLGCSVAVPRYVAAATATRSSDALGFAAAGLATVTGLGLTVAGVIVLWPTHVAGWAFDDPSAPALARALAAFVVTTAVYQITYSVFRGRLMIAHANGLELVCVGALPVLVAVVGPHDVAAMITVLAACIGVASVLFLLIGARDVLGARTRRLPGQALTLLRFGVLRTPGDLAVIALASAAPIVVVHAADTTAAGQASIVLSTLSLVSVAAVPLSSLLLPRVAADHASGAAGDPRYLLLWSAVLHIAVGLCGMLVVAAPLVLELWVPTPPAKMVLAQQVAALGIPAYVVYLVFRSYLDATSMRPYSSFATVGGLAVLAVVLTGGLAAGGDPLIASAASTAAALTTTGAVTWWWTRKQLDVGATGAEAGLLLAWVAGCFALALLAGSDAPAVVAASAVAALVYVLGVTRLRPQWFIVLRQRMVPLRRSVT